MWRPWSVGIVVLVAACASEPGSRCEVGDAPLTLEATEVRDQFVRLDLAYRGRCWDPAFAVWWAGPVAPAAPPPGAASTPPPPPRRTCEALIRRSIWVDLSPLREVMVGTPHFLVHFDGLPGSIDYTVAEPAAPPSADVLGIDQGCGAI